MQLIADELLPFIQRMAGAAFTVDEIAEVIEVDPTTLAIQLSEPGPVRKAYRTGILMRQLQLNERIFRDAKNGSSPAQTLAMKLLTNAQIGKL